MKLTKHERKIVSKINTGEIYDIPSYLKCFKKGRFQKYDIEAIRARFEASEEGKKYKVLKSGHSLFKSGYSTQTIMGQELHTPMLFPRLQSDIDDDEWSYQEAKFIGEIPPSKYIYEGQEFVNDFNQGVFVADDFNDILAFIRLWSYMRRESLVFEVNKPISNDEIGMLYELVPYKHSSKSGKIIIAKNDDNTLDCDDKEQVLYPIDKIHQVAPTHYAKEFIDSKWVINEDHLMMCREFIGTRMYSTAALHAYAANNYKTSEEMHRGINTIVAVAALIISILAFWYNILHPNNIYQSSLDTINKQLMEIETTLNDINTNAIHIEKISQIDENIKAVENTLDNIQKE